MVDVDYVGASGDTVLQMLLGQRLIEQAELLLSRRFDFAPHRRGADGRTALHTAVACGAKNVVQQLIRQPNIIHIKDNEKKTALHVAAQSSSFEVARLLLAHIITTNVNHILDETDQANRTAHDIAVKAGNSEYLRAYEEIVTNQSGNYDRTGASSSGAEGNKMPPFQARADQSGEEGSLQPPGIDFWTRHEFESTLTEDLAKKILGLNGNLGTEIDNQMINQARRKKLLHYHPDKAARFNIIEFDMELRTKISQRINAAHELLMQALDRIRNRAPTSRGHDNW